jgi:hypothetical protein
MWYPGVLPSVKLHALHGSVVPAGVTVLLGLCNPPRRGCGETAEPGLLYPLVWITCCGIVFAEVTKQSRCNTHLLPVVKPRQVRSALGCMSWHNILAFSEISLKSGNSLFKFCAPKIHSSSHSCMPNFPTIF